MQKKIKRGDPLASDGFVDYVKKSTKWKGEPFGDKKFFEKKSHSAEKKSKKSKGGTL